MTSVERIIEYTALDGEDVDQFVVKALVQISL
jgi:hypothetical protein